ncbi:GP63-like [Trichomonas vaginalis G3]|uniref:GP63-like n=1 Tax=Trichomonas vaginalis (strain ATCC PRA-98 / G3) TaxID=412133 RepID=A2EY91_TRIV3|nr:GP63-like [Trichomonas vaginalis G3]|eukprot:XP_001330640.1 GP63-like [Trichomonas vaginalis G3]
MIVFNPRATPEKVVNETDWDNNFYMTILHELTHALGFGDTLFKDYHPYENPEPHKNPVCKLTKFGRDYTFLVTPYSHIFAKKRFGVETFIGDNNTNCPAGIELEDGGSSGTAGSHLEYRTYNTENMVGEDINYPVPFLRFTDAMLAILMDTGNYKVNWANAKPLVYGHPESIDGKPIPDFAINPPQLSFPSNYLISPNDFTGFDYNHYGNYDYLHQQSDVDCQNPQFDLYCKAKDTFYNPKNFPYFYANILADFQTIPYPSQVCEKGKAILPGLTFTEYCYDYVCHGYDSFEIKISEKVIITCNKENAGLSSYYQLPMSDEEGNIQIENRIFTCPDPERFCRTMKLSSMNFDKDPLDPNTKVLEGEPQEKPEWIFDYSDLEKEREKTNPPKKGSPLKVGYIVLIVIVALVVVAAIAVAVYFIYFQKENLIHFQTL